MQESKETHSSVTLKINGIIIVDSDESLIVRTRLYARILYPFLALLLFTAVVGSILPVDWLPAWFGIAIGIIVFSFVVAFPAPYRLFVDKVKKQVMVANSFLPRWVKTYPLHDIQLEKSLRRGDSEYPAHWDIFFVLPNGRRVSAFAHSTEEVVFKVFKLIEEAIQASREDKL